MYFNTIPCTRNGPDLQKADLTPFLIVILREIKKAELADLKYALKHGIGDFLKAPLFGLFFGGVFALGGVVLFYGIFELGMLWLAYPLVIGFSLLGPFIRTKQKRCFTWIQKQQTR